MSSSKEKHLEFIQGVIGRLSQNSFAIRGWTITVISALLALSSKDYVWEILAFAPACFFWFLDAYYLRQERLYRELYDAVRKSEDGKIESFSMDTSEFKSEVASVCETMFSKTIGMVYIPIILIIFSVFIMSFINSK